MRSEGLTVPATTVSLATVSPVVSREGRKNITYVPLPSLPIYILKKYIKLKFWPCNPHLHNPELQMRYIMYVYNK